MNARRSPQVVAALLVATLGPLGLAGCGSDPLAGSDLPTRRTTAPATPGTGATGAGAAGGGPTTGASTTGGAPGGGATSASGGRTLIDATFDGDTPGPVTPDSFTAAVGPAGHEVAAYDSMTFVREPDGAGTFVRTRLAADRILGHNDASGDGNVLVVALEDQSQDSACVSYDVRFSRGFEFSGGGKLPGLLGVAPGVSPGTPTGGGSTAHGWSGRVMWLGPKVWRIVRESGQPNLGVTYLYHPGQAGTYGDDLSWGEGFRHATWHSVRQCYRLNKVGEADGRLQAWLDDEEVLDRSDVVYRTDPKVHITHLDWSVFRGGDTQDWAAGTDGAVDLDNLRVTVG